MIKIGINILLAVIKDFFAYLKLAWLHRFYKVSGDKIKVVFICQYLPAWNKLNSVYQLMKKDDRFEVLLLCVPDNFKDGKWLGQAEGMNDSYDYCISHGYPEAVNAWQGNEWFNLKAYRPHYVFHPRPYNAFMPKPYRTQVVSSYARVCSIMYGYSLSKQMIKWVLNRDFYRYVYYYMAETQCAMDGFVNLFPRSYKKGDRKCKVLGMPSLQDILAAKEMDSPSWGFSKQSFRVMWTPRWTSEKRLGGTNFLAYYKEFLRYAKEHTDIDFLFRPHPLALNNFVKQGEMTQEEVDEFRLVCERQENLHLDQEKTYEASMWGTDVLVTDTSSIVPEYFLTGKPLIFCLSNMELTFNAFAEKMISGCYVAHSIQEVFAYVEQIKNGQDDMQWKRKEIAEEIFGDVTKISHNILQELVEDWEEAKR